MPTFDLVMVKKKKDIEAIRVYTPTLALVRKHVAKIPGMTITRFYDEAAKKALAETTNIKKRLDTL